MMNKKIKRNRIKCLKCGDIIESVSVHDFRWCSCGSCAVDGGKEYLRRCGNKEDFEDISECEEAYVIDKDIFHVHTYRCRHAEEVADEEYVKKAIELGARGIWFTDHAPFPGDPFESRMRYDQLDEYLTTLSSLKSKYEERINVHIGLEAEYFPSFDKEGYYRRLRYDPRIEILLLGQHMAEVEPGQYSFSWSKEKLVEDEYKVQGEAIIQGIESAYFDVVAHPDRIFRKRQAWDSDMSRMSAAIIDASSHASIPLEINESSKEYPHYSWHEFWSSGCIEIPQVIGLDAHSIDEMVRRFHFSRAYEIIPDNEETLIEVSGEHRRLQIFYEDNWVLARDIKTGIIEQGTSLKDAKNNIIKILELQM